MKTSQKQIILASTSPRRRELMKLTGLPFRAVASKFEEDMTIPLPPTELAKYLSFGKAAEVASRYHHALVIAADTFVVSRNKALGKPHTPEKARKMLRMLSGKTHTVVTGLSILDAETLETVSKAIEATITFKKLTDEEIDRYIESGEPLDRAGAYAIQGLGSFFVKKIEGDYLGVVGLPLYTLRQELKKFGVNIL